MRDLLLKIGNQETVAKGGSDIDIDNLTEGFRSSLILDLFTRENWFGNLFLNPDEKIGNRVDNVLDREITSGDQQELRLEVGAALKRKAYNNPEFDIDVVDGRVVCIIVRIQGQKEEVFQVDNNGNVS